MARLKAPLLSLGASGTIAKALVFASWKGIPYARVHVIPANPNTAGQQEVRGVFSTLNEMWKRMPARARLPFQLAVRGLPLTARNKHIQVNLPALQGQAVLDALVMSVSTGQATAPSGSTIVDGTDGTISITADAPTEPVGYTFLEFNGIATLDGDPSPVGIFPSYAAIGPDGVLFSINVPTDGLYQVGVYAYWQRVSDGRGFISTAERAQITVTGN